MHYTPANYDEIFEKTCMEYYSALPSRGKPDVRK